MLQILLARGLNRQDFIVRTRLTCVCLGSKMQGALESSTDQRTVVRSDTLVPVPRGMAEDH